MVVFSNQLNKLWFSNCRYIVCFGSFFRILVTFECVISPCPKASPWLRASITCNCLYHLIKTSLLWRDWQQDGGAHRQHLNMLWQAIRRMGIIAQNLSKLIWHLKWLGKYVPPFHWRLSFYKRLLTKELRPLLLIPEVHFITWPPIGETV